MILLGIMTGMGSGHKIYELRKRIQGLYSELALLEASLSDIPELINSANLLRINESLKLTNSKKSEIISVYEKYSQDLESILDTVFEIQKDLMGILKIQSSLISKQKPIRKQSSKRSKK